MKNKTKQAISARERALCQRTVCFEFLSKSENKRRVPVNGHCVS